MIYLFLAQGFEEIEALTAVDLLRRAGAAVTTVGIGGRTVSGSHGIPVTADCTEAEASAELRSGAAMEMVILPGGMPGASHLDESDTVDAFLREGERQDAYLCAICAAPFVLGRRGLLDGYEAVCYPGYEPELRGARLTDKGVVCDRRRITGRAMGASTEFALALVAAAVGEDAARRVRQSILA